jgi:hypothetical protein
VADGCGSIVDLCAPPLPLPSHTRALFCIQASLPALRLRTIETLPVHAPPLPEDATWLRGRAYPTDESWLPVPLAPPPPAPAPHPVQAVLRALRQATQLGGAQQQRRPVVPTLLGPSTGPFSSTAAAVSALPLTAFLAGNSAFSLTALDYSATELEALMASLDSAAPIGPLPINVGRSNEDGQPPLLQPHSFGRTTVTTASRGVEGMLRASTLRDALQPAVSGNVQVLASDTRSTNGLQESSRTDAALQQLDQCAVDADLDVTAKAQQQIEAVPKALNLIASLAAGAAMRHADAAVVAAAEAVSSASVPGSQENAAGGGSAAAAAAAHLHALSAAALLGHLPRYLDKVGPHPNPSLPSLRCCYALAAWP